MFEQYYYLLNMMLYERYEKLYPSIPEYVMEDLVFWAWHKAVERIEEFRDKWETFNPQGYIVKACDYEMGYRIRDWIRANPVNESNFGLDVDVIFDEENIDPLIETFTEDIDYDKEMVDIDLKKLLSPELYEQLFDLKDHVLKKHMPEVKAKKNKIKAILGETE